MVNKTGFYWDNLKQTKTKSHSNLSQNLKSYFSNYRSLLINHNRPIEEICVINHVYKFKIHPTVKTKIKNIRFYWNHTHFNI